MNWNDFEMSLTEDQAPAGLPTLVRALWWDAHGGWDKAHTIAQDVEGQRGAWVHAYLHRREGDQANAAYWYRQAGQPYSRDSLAQERKAIVEALLDDEE